MYVSPSNRPQSACVCTSWGTLRTGQSTRKFIFSWRALTDVQRIVFIVTGSVFTLFHLGGALGHNTATILVTRALAGIFGSARKCSSD